MRPATAAAALLTAALAGAGASHWLAQPATPAEAAPPSRGEAALDTAARLALPRAYLNLPKATWQGPAEPAGAVPRDPSRNPVAGIENAEEVFTIGEETDTRPGTEKRFGRGKLQAADEFQRPEAAAGIGREIGDRQGIDPSRGPLRLIVQHPLDIHQVIGAVLLTVTLFALHQLFDLGRRDPV